MLDTSVVRGYIHGDTPASSITELSKYGPAVAVSIPFWAELELVNALLAKFGGISLADWSKRIPDIDRILDPDMPVAPSKAALFALAAEPAGSTSDPEYSKRRHQVIWAFSASLKTEADFTRDIYPPDEHGVIKLGMSMSPDGIAKMVNRERAWFTAVVESARKGMRAWQVAAASPGVGDLRSRRLTHEEVLHGLPKLLSLQWSEAQLKDADHFLHLLAHFVRTERYDPGSEKHKNDAVDLQILQSLVLPGSILCTEDQGFIGRLSNYDSNVRSRVMTVKEVLAHCAKLYPVG